ncbi:hypothetical protein ACH4D5_02605 [Streptomyces sp. NPDC018029]|uniref:hypothetical protein n=1 Tax=Streptomyces sp. NPDC018029 TaxID=3365032 RepID=UPI00378F22DB
MSYNQPGPYAGQPQQPGPYGQPPQGVPPQQPYGQYPQAPYGPVPPQGGGKKKTGLVVGAVVVVAALAVGGYFVYDKVSASSVSDDGKTYKLTAPETVLGSYKKDTSAGDAGGMSSSDLAELEKQGVKNPKEAHAAYNYGKGPAMKSLNYAGAYGEIDDPEKVVDAMFADMKNNQAKGSAGGFKLTGSPEEFTPDGFENGIMKCQKAEFKMGETGANDEGVPGSFQTPVCVWGDHSTVASATYSDVAATGSGEEISLDDVATQVANLRDDVRVEIK